MGWALMGLHGVPDYFEGPCSLWIGLDGVLANRLTKFTANTIFKRTLWKYV